MELMSVGHEKRRYSKVRRRWRSGCAPCLDDYTTLGLAQNRTGACSTIICNTRELLIESKLSLDLVNPKRLKQIPFLDIVEALQADSALHAVPHLFGVIFFPLQ